MRQDLAPGNFQAGDLVHQRQCNGGVRVRKPLCRPPDQFEGAVHTMSELWERIKAWAEATKEVEATAEDEATEAATTGVEHLVAAEEESVVFH